MPRVLVLTGLPGSGKSEAAEIAKLLDIPVFSMGDVIRTETTNRGLEANSQNIGMVAMNLREEFGDDIVLQRLWPIVRDALIINNIVLIDGMRSIAEKNALIQLMGFEPEILAILASEDIRNSRLVGRKRSDDVKIDNDGRRIDSTDETEKNHAISERDKREKGWGVEELLEQANYKIDNEDSMDSFRTDVKALLEGLNTPD